MPKTLTEGDPVRLADCEATAPDVKSGLFYPHYSGLRGVIAKVYADGTASINVSEDTLPADVRERHRNGSQAMRQKWLDGLSDEARNRLSAAEKKFALRYTILVSLDDLTADALPAASDDTQSGEPSRKSLADLDAEESRHLAEVAKKARA